MPPCHAPLPCPAAGRSALVPISKKARALSIHDEPEPILLDPTRPTDCVASCLSAQSTCRKKEADGGRCSRLFNMMTANSMRVMSGPVYIQRLASMTTVTSEAWLEPTIHAQVDILPTRRPRAKVVLIDAMPPCHCPSKASVCFNIATAAIDVRSNRSSSSSSSSLLFASLCCIAQRQPTTSDLIRGGCLVVFARSLPRV
ncbi:hypothetical protein IWZ01DRAFT_165596 [Phyllosticta capitalensis]